MSKAKEMLDQNVCPDCGGTGELSTDAEDGEGHTMKGTGEPIKCYCQTNNNEDESRT